MKWPKPEFGSGRVRAAGQLLAERVEPAPTLTVDDAYNIAGNWRSAHGFPLQVLGVTLNRRAKKVDPKALYAQRLKRIPSIISKLKRFDTMQLDGMNDLGGCRAIVKDIKAVDELVAVYEKRPCPSAELVRKYDYIANPKPDGYRSIHLVYRYKSTDTERAVFNKSRIEIQIRSKLQHAWSTAVETVDTFTDQALKSGIGDSRWKRFFVLAAFGSAFLERRAMIPGIVKEDDPSQQEDGGYAVLRELRVLSHELRVMDVLGGLAYSIETLVSKKVKGSIFILLLNTREKTVRPIGFPNAVLAATEYLRLEKEFASRKEIQTVMVSVDSITQLRRAFPNYFLDTAAFLGIIQEMLRIERAYRKELASKKHRSKKKK